MRHTSHMGDATSAVVSGSCAKSHGDSNSSHACGTQRSSRVFGRLCAEITRSLVRG